MDPMVIAVDAIDQDRVVDIFIGTLWKNQMLRNPVG